MDDSVVRRCADDALRVDGVRGRLRSCQRELDAASGAEGQLRLAQLEERRLADERAAELARVTAERDARPRWRRVALWIVAGVAAGYAGGRLHQWGRDRE